MKRFVLMVMDGAAEVHFPTKSFLARPLSDFSQVRLVVGSLAELAQAAVYVPERVKGLRAEVEGALPSVSAAEALWKELIVRYGAEKDAADKKAKEKPKTPEATAVAGNAGDTRTITLPGGDDDGVAERTRPDHLRHKQRSSLGRHRLVWWELQPGL